MILLVQRIKIHYAVQHHGDAAVNPRDRPTSIVVLELVKISNIWFNEFRNLVLISRQINPGNACSSLFQKTPFISDAPASASMVNKLSGPLALLLFPQRRQTLASDIT